MTPSPGKRGLKALRQARPSFAWLLCLILSYLVISGIEVDHPLILATGVGLRVATFVLALYVSGVSRRFYVAMVSFILIVGLLSIAARMYNGWLVVLEQVAWSAIPLLIPFVILRKIKKEFIGEGVDTEVVLGALCAYLYIGGYFAYIYKAIGSISNSPFFAQAGAGHKLDYLYFSFVTLTTVGYGDLSPAFGAGRMIAVVEAIVGQLYLVSVVALVISAYGKGKKSS